MKRLFLLIPLTVIAILIDCFLFPALSQNGIRPLLVLSLALAATAATKVQDGIVIALIGGLLCDLFCNPYLGFSAAAYLAAVCILYGFVRKNQPKLPLLLIFALIACTAAEAMVFVFSLIIGARFPIRTRLLLSVLPSVVLESLAVLPLAALLRVKGKGTFDRR